MFSFEFFTKQINYGLYSCIYCICQLFVNDLFVLLAILSTVPLPGELHYEPGLHVCILAEICNHTYNPECGKEKNDLDKRTFMDECDMIEYNCDYKKEYTLIPYKECGTNHTKEIKEDLSTKRIHTESTEPGRDNYTKNGSKSDSLITSTLVYTSNTNNEKSKDTTVTLPKTKKISTTLTTPEHKHSNAGICTCGAKTKMVLTTVSQKTTSTTESVTTKKQISTTRSASTTDMTTHITTLYIQDKTSPLDKITPSTQLNVTVNCTRKTTIPISSTPSKPHTSIATTLSSSKNTIKHPSTSSTHLKDTTTISSSNSFATNQTYGTTETIIKETKTESIKPNNVTKKITLTSHVTPKNTSTTLKSAETTTKATSKNVNVKTSPCNSETYPKDCNRPLKWETTAKGETRDFYQILRAKYGDRVKIIRGTTHWPRRRNYFRGKYSFYPSRHNET